MKDNIKQGKTEGKQGDNRGITEETWERNIKKQEDNREKQEIVMNIFTDKHRKHAVVLITVVIILLIF